MPERSLPQRNQLVWPTPEGWQQLMGQPCDAQAARLLRHWQDQALPLVVTTHGGAEPGHDICLGLPAPSVWSRRKLDLQLPRSALQRCADFPTLQALLERPLAGALAGCQLPLQQLLAALQALGVAVQVYGSYGWQHLVGMAYVRPASDLDLRLPVPDAPRARAVVGLLQALQLPLRVDGELVFPDGAAVAWREYRQWMHGRVAQVLVKTRHGIALREPARLGQGLCGHALLPPHRAAA